MSCCCCRMFADARHAASASLMRCRSGRHRTQHVPGLHLHQHSLPAVRPRRRMDCRCNRLLLAQHHLVRFCRQAFLIRVSFLTTYRSVILVFGLACVRVLLARASTARHAVHRTQQHEHWRCPRRSSVNQLHYRLQIVQRSVGLLCVAGKCVECSQS